MFVFIICKHWLGCLFFIDCQLFNHLRPTYGISNPTLVRNPFPDGDITGESQRKAKSKEGYNKTSRSIFIEDKLIWHFSLHLESACDFINVPLSKVHLLSLVISHCAETSGMCPLNSSFQSTLLFYSKLPTIKTGLRVSICLYEHPQISKTKTSIPQGHSVPSFHWKERNSEGRAQ